MAADGDDGVAITALGAQGDGIGTLGGVTRFVPFALPGERWRLSDDGATLVGPPSPERRAPPCRHFGTCGGCVAQHMVPAAYSAWKRDILVAAFAKGSIDGSVDPLVETPEASRRRVVMAARWLPSGVVLGFHERASDRLLAIDGCVIADPSIVAALPVIRQVAARLLARKGELRLTITRVDAGLDIAATGGKTRLDAGERQAIADLMTGSPILRVSLDGDPVVTRAAPLLTVGPAKVSVPPAVFLQASPAAERAMVEQVTAAVGKAKSVADLFCGLGTFTLPLARRARLLAIDTDAAGLAALGQAAREAQGLKPIETRQRDLMREPLSRKELEPFDAVVFDPPRAGAEAQAAMLAKSTVPVVVAVSCNPTTLVRDVAILADGGYEVRQVTPIDQFLYANHLEAVAVLARPTARGRKRA